MKNIAFHFKSLPLISSSIYFIKFLSRRRRHHVYVRAPAKKIFFLNENFTIHRSSSCVCVCFVERAWKYKIMIKSKQVQSRMNK